MGNNQHLKRHSAPVAWPIKRKNIAFITKPMPGSHKSDYVVPVVVLLRDVLGYAETAKEAKLIINNREVLVNGKRITKFKSPVGLFDVFQIKDTDEKYLVLFNELGKIKLVNYKSDLLNMRVSGKKILPKNKYQINFMNGFNILVDEKTFKNVKVEDTIRYDLVKKKVDSILSLKKDSYVYIFDGKFQGKVGQIQKIEEYQGLTKDIVEIKIGDEIHSTAKDYCFVIGDKKEDLKLFS